MFDREQTLSFNERNIAEFRSNGGRLSSFGTAPVLLLTTTGAKTGKRPTSPMMYLADDKHSERIYVFASKAGADTNPAWYYNLVANPNQVEVELGSETFRANAAVLPEEERAAVFAVQAGRYSGFAAYQSMTSRPIPVVALTLQAKRQKGEQ